MARRLALTLAVLGLLVTSASRADEAGKVLAQCRKALGNLPGDIVVTLTRSQGDWRIANLRCNFHEGCELKDSSLGALSGMTALDGLTLGADWGTRGEYTRLTPEGFHILAGLHLRQLDLPWTVRDEGLTAICSMTGLERLYLGRYELDKNSGDGALTHLVKLRNLRRLGFGTGITDTSLEHISELDKIEELDLAGKEIMEAGIASLARLTRLRSLTLNRLTEQGVESLKRLPRLDRLDIAAYEPSPGNASLAELKGLRWLRVGWMPSAPATRVRLPESIRGLEVGHAGSLGCDVVKHLDLQSARHIEHIVVNLRYRRGGPNDLSDLHWLRSLPELKSVRLDNATDSDVRQLAELPSLRAITLSSVCLPSQQFGDDGIKALAGLRQVESFEIGGFGSKMTDAGLDVLRNFTNLRRLALVNCTGLTAQGFAMISELKQLRVLSVDTYQLGSADSALAFVTKLTELEELCLEDVGPRPLTDEGLRHLAPLKRLRRLDMSKSPGYTDAGLASLTRELPSLESLKFMWRVRGQSLKSE